jgi:hypothetical protein
LEIKSYGRRGAAKVALGMALVLCGLPIYLVIIGFVAGIEALTVLLIYLGVALFGLRAQPRNYSQNTLNVVTRCMRFDLVPKLLTLFWRTP